MKILKFTMLLLAFSLVLNINAQEQALVIGYSQVNNVYEDENIKAELIQMSLRITNKTDKSIFIDRKSSFYYINETPICLFEGIEKKMGDGVTKIEQPIDAVAPKGEKWIASINDQLKFREYNSIKGKSNSIFGNNKYSTYLTGEPEITFMGYMETLRFELANDKSRSCSKLHLTGDESFLKAKVSINYSLEPKMDNLKAFTIETWVSDMILSKFYLQPTDKVTKTRAVNVQGRKLNILHVFADSPFEYEEDKSPLGMYLVYFRKGAFFVYKFNSDDEQNELKKKKKNEIVSNFGTQSKLQDVLIWEGESSNWVQTFTDSYSKFLQEDGMKPKEALKTAKSKAKSAKKDQTLKL